mmetsp:Transcript_18923/g.45191  ORF Transcript_18923/g.45191 Transcript_18923/m.45191 type:complete len:133 (-) Transcript_18923:273-671(-)
MVDADSLPHRCTADWALLKHRCAPPAGAHVPTWNQDDACHLIKAYYAPAILMLVLIGAGGVASTRKVNIYFQEICSKHSKGWTACSIFLPAVLHEGKDSVRAAIWFFESHVPGHKFINLTVRTTKRVRKLCR